jgi:uncharacterized protein (TIGR00730 family)
MSPMTKPPGSSAYENDDARNEEWQRSILESPTRLRADRDPEFLARDELRAIRLQLEFLKPELALSEAGIRSTIVVFGSTRFPERPVAERALEQARAALAAAPGGPELERAVAVAERVLANSRYYDVAREFGRIVGREGCDAQGCRVLVMTGGGPGLMEAANRGAREADADTIGLNIQLPREQAPNPYLSPHLSFQFRYFALRKMHFMLRAKALVAFPGGYGTLDELFETLCLIQTGKREALPVVLVGESYWRKVFDPEFLVAEGAISAEDRQLFRFAETAQQIWDHIQGWYRREGRSIFA